MVLLSFIPDVLLLVTGVLPGTTARAVFALALMHIAVTVLAVPTFQRALPVLD